jgi:hypothetical protein
MTLRRIQPRADGILINLPVIVSFTNLRKHALSLLKVAGLCAMSPLRTKPGAL